MQKVLKRRRSILAWALTLSILFPAGILMIIFGFSDGMLFLAIPGVLFVVAGFYAMPVLWVKFGELSRRANLCRTIDRDGVRSVAILAQMRGVTKKTMLAEIRSLLEKAEEGRRSVTAPAAANCFRPPVARRNKQYPRKIFLTFFMNNN